ncbi:hypothetical protein EHV15_35825 [Paenibacillus oralis]|uniref:Uncharacterized protein n=1 Tax=Paenibacillus oralis TaxID=2490856 RepID=A0A3P3TAM7_9BACL|nr:hypothetical protein [Paenibacillus oralis]RRJ54942.1 hypothetical protein EHV15_35825 [Paenibacillus oralis]
MNDIIDTNAQKLFKLLEVKDSGIKNHIILLLAEAFETGVENGIKKGREQALEEAAKAIHSLSTY